MAPSDSEVEQRQQLEFLRALSRVAAGVAGGLSLVWAIWVHWPLGAAMLACTAVLFASAPFIARRYGARVAAHFTAGALTLAVGFVAVSRGDLSIGVLLFLAVNPLLLAWLASRRAAIGWAVVGAALSLACLWRVESGRGRYRGTLGEPAMLAQRNTLETFGLIGALSLLTTAALSIERRRRLVSSERTRLREAFDERAERAAGARLHRLASGVAHEINNPLAWMTSGLSFLQRRFQGPTAEAEVVEVITEIAAGSQRVGAIVADLQAVARHDERPSDDADPARVLRIVQSLATAELSRQGGLEVEGGADLPLMHGNEGAVAELLLELMFEASPCDVLLRVEVAPAQVSFVLHPVGDREVSRARALLEGWGGSLEVEDGVARLCLRRADSIQ